MATFVQLSEDDPGFELVRMVVGMKFKDEQSAAREKEAAALSKLVTERRYADVLKQGVFANGAAILAATPADTNTVMNLSFSLLLNVESTNVVSDFVSRFAELLTSDKSVPQLKIKLLATLFNLTESAYRCTVFEHLVRYVLETGQHEALADQLQHVDAWMKDWKLDGAKEARLLLSLALICEASGKALDSQQFMYRHFRALEKAPVDALPGAKEHAARAIVAAIQSQDIINADTLTGFAAVKQLEKDAKYSQLFALLKIVAHKDIRDFLKFVEEQKVDLEKLGLNHAQTASKMRILTLSSIGVNSRDVTFASLREALVATSDDEIEGFVIDAVDSGLVDAKIDQNSKIVHISRTTPRQFGVETWRQLGKQLDSWHENARQVLASLADIRGGKDVK